MSIVILSKGNVTNSKTFKTLHCPFPHKIIGCHALGWGNARNIGASESGYSQLMIQLNSDLTITPELWKFIGTLKRGEFAMQIYKEQNHTTVCSRVFAIHTDDFWRIGGCDNNLKYYFEDGDFYINARRYGLKFRRVPDSAAIHTNHKHAFYNPPNILRVEAEACRAYVKYGQAFMPFKLINRFFVPFRDYRVALQHLMARTLFIVYYIIVGERTKWK